MKVCDVVINSIWFDPRVRKQIVGYMENGIEVCCVGLKCTKYNEEKVSQIPCKTVIVDNNSKYAGKQKNAIKKLLRDRAMEGAITKAIIEQKPDIIHANDLNALIPAYRASKKLKCGLIYDSHEIYTENHHVVKKKLYRYILKLQEKYICKRIDKMVCVSNAAADYFEKMLKIEKPIVVTNCSLKAEQTISETKNDGFEVLNHGQFYAGRGYDIMVEAIPLFKEYPEIKLALRGMGIMEMQLKERAKELGDENFRFYPPVHVSELIREAARSKIGVAITEGICINFKLSVSNKLFEYASAGLPVIMSDIPEHRYLNDKYSFGIILKENTPKAFADAVVKFYTDKEFYEKCSSNAILLSSEVNWEMEFKRLIDFEKQLIK